VIRAELSAALCGSEQTAAHDRTIVRRHAGWQHTRVCVAVRDVMGSRVHLRRVGLRTYRT